MPKLFFRFASMASGKSAHLLAVAGNYEAIGKRTLILKPRLDTRTSEMIIESRLQISRKVDQYLDADTVIPDEWLQNVACVLVDESQFLSEKVVDQLREITLTHRLPVICYGLRTDYQLRLFEGSRRLFEVADVIEELTKTVCADCCLRKSIVNHRKAADVVGQIAVGGSELYKSVCYECFRKIALSH